MMAYHPKVAAIFLPICFVVSLGLMGLGIWLRGKTQRFVKTARETTGEIVGSQRRHSMSGSGKFTNYALVRFVTDAGEEVLYESMAGFPWAGRDPGKQVPILYDPDDPQKARINSFVELVLPWGIFLWTGVLMFCCGLFALGYYLFH
jgi:hypothetical protein